MLHIRDWELGIRDRGLGTFAQSPVPSPQSPVLISQSPIPSPKPYPFVANIYVFHISCV